jgi:hypothetical protein
VRDSAFRDNTFAKQRPGCEGGVRPRYENFGNTLFHNYFVENVNQAWDLGLGRNCWDNGALLSDFLTECARTQRRRP